MKTASFRWYCRYNVVFLTAETHRNSITLSVFTCASKLGIVKIEIIHQN